ncbi:MAG: type II toxin-antitoxin system prevent-host-death family antitoxin [Polymorphobacter sp.]
MELTVSEGKARFSEAAAAALRGERVTVTKDGKPYVEIVAASVEVVDRTQANRDDVLR